MHLQMVQIFTLRLLAVGFIVLVVSSTTSQETLIADHDKVTTTTAVRVSTPQPLSGHIRRSLTRDATENGAIIPKRKTKVRPKSKASDKKVKKSKMKGATVKKKLPPIIQLDMHTPSGMPYIFEY